MNTKIIFFDIDGTILSHRNFKISSSTKAAIKAVQKNGHLAFVNTGRTLAEMEHEITDIGFDGYVCGCGTYISYQDKVLFQKTVPSDITKALITDFKSYQIEAILEGSSAIYYDSETKIEMIRQILDSQVKEHHFNVKAWQDENISIDKFCIWPATAEGYLLFYNKYKDLFDFIDRKMDFYEVVPKGLSKATGIQFLLEHLDIPHENTYALGDGANDLPMLRYVKHSIAMENADEETRSLVSYITKDVDEDGVYHALRHFNII
jgi:Cof subfamily protein (haloacid dehalogenase superfamily)